MMHDPVNDFPFFKGQIFQVLQRLLLLLNSSFCIHTESFLALIQFHLNKVGCPLLLHQFNGVRFCRHQLNSQRHFIKSYKFKHVLSIVTLHQDDLHYRKRNGTLFRGDGMLGDW
jgi:hypothetical protein